MTRSLRSAHRRIFVLLLVVLPALVSLALSVRGRVPVNKSLPGASATRVEPANLGDAPPALIAPGIWVRTLKDPTDLPRAVELRCDADPKTPDLLLYWGSAPSTDGALPEGALLLGSVSGAGTTTFELPTAARAMAGGRNGSIILYSLARQEVLASGPAATAGGTNR